MTSLSLPTPKLKFTIRKQNQQKHARQEQKNLILILRPQNRFGPLELVGLAWLDKSFFCYFWHVLYSKSLVIKILTYVFWTESSPFYNFRARGQKQGSGKTMCQLLSRFPYHTYVSSFEFSRQFFFLTETIWLFFHVALYFQQRSMGADLTCLNL